MNWKIVFKIQGFILFVIGLSMIPAFLISILYNEGDKFALFISIIITLLFAGFLIFIFKNSSSFVRSQEGFVSVTLGWIFASVFAAIPFYIHGSFGTFIDCTFETMSGLTTTGATILTDIESIPHGLLFWRSLTHWLGGMGIILLTLAILPLFGITGNQLFKAEVPGPVKDRFKPKISDTAKYLWIIYSGLTVIEVILLMFGGMDLFDSLCHTFGTMATGGFSTYNSSVAHFNSVYIEFVIIVFMFLAGINFTLYFFILNFNFKSFFKNKELQFYSSVVFISIIFITLNLFLEIESRTFNDFLESLRKSSFQVVSIITTTGFCTADFNLWPFFAQYLLVILMFFGGSGGSTGGGMKQIRIMILLKSAYKEILKLIHPNTVHATRIEKQSIPDSVVKNVMAFFFIFISIFAIITLFLTFMGYDLTTSLTAGIATLSNIGPGLGRVGAVENYAFFDPLSKVVLTFAMLLGRLEFFSVLIFIFSIFNKR